MSMADSLNAPVVPEDPAMMLKGVSKRFGSLTALSDLTFGIRRGEILGIAGPNGAGKTTLLNICTGLFAPSSGDVEFEGRVVSGLGPHRCCHIGISRTFQMPQVFSSLTVEENVSTGAIFGQEKTPARRAIQEDVDAILQMVGLDSQRRLAANRVDLMTRKRIMLASALATKPKMVFLDEPLSGLSVEEVDAFVDLFQRIHATLALTLVVVEHKVRALAALSQRILILNFGSLLCLDRPDVVLRNPQVVDIYLGSKNLA